MIYERVVRNGRLLGYIYRDQRYDHPNFSFITGGRVGGTNIAYINARIDYYKAKAKP